MANSWPPCRARPSCNCLTGPVPLLVLPFPQCLTRLAREAEVHLQRFLARQPIFNSERAVYGYEPLYRSGPENYYDPTQADLASASTVDSILLFGIERLAPGCRSFINCTRDFLVRDFATMLPKDRVVIEILETIQMDRQVVECCRCLKQAGYAFALDDFQDRPDWKPMVALADFIKVDLLKTPAEDQLRLAGTYLPMKIRMRGESGNLRGFSPHPEMGIQLFSGLFLQPAGNAVARRHPFQQAELSAGTASRESR